VPPPLHQTSNAISPELVLVSRDLVTPVPADSVDEPASTPIPPGVLETDRRDAMLRICELSDVNPPRRGRLALAIAVPAVLWAEALLVVASLVPFSAL